MNKERFIAANAIALITHGALQPLDLIKVRSQMLQEGKTFNGLAFQRGVHPTLLFNEIYAAGGGYKKFWTSFDGFFARTVAYTSARVWGFLYFYDWVNHDPRRVARWDFFMYAGLAGGMVAGVLTNPFDIVFTRMQVDEMYPQGYKRNYKSFAEGFAKVAEEGALFRGAGVNGLKIGALLASMTMINDLAKEQSYYFLGPSWINRFWATLSACVVGTVASLPFDMIRTRMHTMRPLPNGELPYKNSLDCLVKIQKYECSIHHSSNYQSFLIGGYAYGARLFGICYLSQFLLDYYYGMKKQEEQWTPARHGQLGGITFDIHDPYTLAYHKLAVRTYTKPANNWTNAMHPDSHTHLLWA